MLEAVGVRVIHGLLDLFVPAVMSKCRNDLYTEEGKLFNLISVSLRELNRIHGGNLIDHYNQLQLVTDYICGMTDTYALNLYQRLEGMQLWY